LSYHLSHPDIDAGAGYGFLCPQDGTIKEEGVQITRRVESQDTVYTDPHADTLLWIAFDVLCADELRDPNGAKHPKTRLQDYAKLCEFLLKTEGSISPPRSVSSSTWVRSATQQTSAIAPIILLPSVSSTTLVITSLRLIPPCSLLLFGMAR